MITYNASIVASGEVSSFTIPYSHSGDNGLLMVAVSLLPNNGQEVVSIKYGGVDLSDDIKVQTRMDIRTEVWYLVNPPVGTYDVVIELTGSAKAIINVFSMTGVNQSAPFYFKTTCSGTEVTVIPFTIQEKAGNGILGIGATNSLAYAHVFTELGQTELFRTSYNNEMLSQVVYAFSTQTGTLSIANFLTEVSNWSLMLFNIEAV